MRFLIHRGWWSGELTFSPQKWLAKTVRLSAHSRRTYHAKGKRHMEGCRGERLDLQIVYLVRIYCAKCLASLASLSWCFVCIAHPIQTAANQVANEAEKATGGLTRNGGLAILA
jgi:hypothetical protein